MPDTDPAALLREAARLMRERATAASPAPWWSWQEGRDGWGGDSFIGTSHGTSRGDDLYVHVGHNREEYARNWEDDQDYIAGMHPGVALAVADWLDARAAEYDEVTSGPYGPAAAAFVAGGDADPAVTLARIYLGKSDDQPAT